MTAAYSYDGGALTNVRRGTVELTQSAEHGAVGTGRLTVNNAAGTLSIVGQVDFAATESACSVPETFDGFIFTRTYRRGPTSVEQQRDIDVELEDLNAMLGFRLINDQIPALTKALGGRRPIETVAQRGAWLMASPFVSGLFADNGRVDFPDIEMDKADYRYSQYPGDVLGDMAAACGAYNHYIRNFGAGPELVFRDDNASTADTSDVRISNVISDVAGDATGLTFYPFKDFTLRRSPERVKSKLGFSHANGTVVVERAATATAFNGERGGTASNSNVKTDSQATIQATSQLFQIRTEEDVLEGTILVPAASVNLIAHGDRMQARFEHLTNEGYGTDFTWFRVLECTKKTLLKPAALYEVRVKLSPQETVQPSPVCSDTDTAAATYYPLGGPGAEGSSSSNLVGTNIAYYHRGGLAEPQAPNPSYQGYWHFPTYGAGGLGSTDYFASGFDNMLRFIVVGNGTLTIQTERWQGQLQPYTIIVEHVVAGTPQVVGATLTGTAGDATAVVITTADDPDCIHLISLQANNRVDGVHIGMGWSQAVWS